MNIQDLLDRLHARNVAVSADKDEVVLNGPRGALDAGLVSLIRENKQALLEELRKKGAKAEGRPLGRKSDGFKITPELLSLVRLTQAEIDGIVATVPGGAANIQDIYPLSPLQEGILFHHAIESEGDPYLLSSLFAFDSRQRLDSFVRALQAVIDRHDILRTAIFWEGLSQPVQVVYRHAPLAVIEAPAEDDERGQDAATRMRALTDPRRLRIDLRQAPLMRAYVGPDPRNGEWLLSLLNHHMVSDHVGLEIIAREIRLVLDGQESLLPKPVPYRDFIARTHAVDATVHERYFRELLGDVDEPTAPFGLMDTYGNGSLVTQSRRYVDDGLAARIRACSGALHMTPAAFFHVAWAQVLAKCSNRDDVVFGTVLSGRLQNNDAGQMMGLFINTLPVRARLAGRTVGDVLEQMRDQLTDLLAHEQAPLMLAQRCSGIPAGTPLFTSIFNYRYSRAGKTASPSASIWEGVRVMEGEERSNYPLGMSVDDLDDGFALTLQAVAGVDPDAVAARVAAALESLVDALERSPQTSIGQLSALPSAERKQLLEDFNDTAVAWPDGRLVHEIFESNAEERPEAVALVYEDQSIGYGELNRRANRLAHHLIASGVRPDDRVAILMERGIDVVTALLAVLKAGAAYVPLDPAYPPQRLAYMLEDCAPRLLLTQQALLDSLCETAIPAANPVWVIDAQAPAWAGRPDHNPDRATTGLSPFSLAYVIYTSGSTGMPKGVMIEHRSIANFARAQIDLFSLTPTSRVLQFVSLAFDVSVAEVMMALCSGAALCLAAREDLGPGESLQATLLRHRVTHVNLPMAALAALTAMEQLGMAETVIVGGEALPASLANRWSEKVRLFNAYGPTEATVCASALRCVPGHDGAVPIGKPLPNTRIYVLDAGLQPVPAGAVGEIFIGGHGIARGYLNRPELTADRFVRNPFNADAGERLYKTGDLGRWAADGNLEYIGRNDFQVKIRGFRIELGEIEAQLLACDGIREATMTVREDLPGERRLVAYLLTGGDPPSTAALRDRLAGKLAEYMIPQAFIFLDAFPLTPNGKLDRKALPAPDRAVAADRAYEAPQDEVESAIAHIWQDLLGVERVGRHDHFFELGGHSLKLISLVEKMRQAGLRLDARDVFKAPTLSAMSKRVRKSDGASGETGAPPNLIPIDCETVTPEMLTLARLTQQEIDRIASDVPQGHTNIQDIYPLAPMQEGILFHHMMQDEGDIYLMRSVLQFDNRKRLDDFLGALQLLIDRHDILRTALCWQGLQHPMQVVWRKASLPVTQFELDADPLAQLHRLVNPRRMRLDLQSAPMMAAFTAADPCSEGWYMVLLNHHMMGDHFTMDLLIGEIRTVLEGKADSLPPPVPYRNLVAHVRTVPVSEHEIYFRQQLSDISEPSAPFGILDTHGNTGDVTETTLHLEPAFAARIRKTTSRLGVSAAVLFHAAWAQVLARFCASDDVVFGTVLFGRMLGAAGADQVVGLFINTLPLRVPMQGLNVVDMVLDVNRRLSELLAHEQAPLSLAQRCSGVASPLPLFTTLLNYRHNHAPAHKGAASLPPAWDGMRMLSSDDRNNFPLTVSVDDNGNAFELGVRCIAGFEGPRILAHVETALMRLVETLETIPAVSAPARSLDMLPAPERHQLIETFNRTSDYGDPSETIHRLFELQAAASPDAPAVAYQDGNLDECLSYGELNRRANRLARHLLNLGVEPEDRIALCVERGVGMVVGILAILKAGAAYVPLDPAYPPERLLHMLTDSKPAALLTQQALADDLPGKGVPMVVLDGVNDIAAIDLLSGTNPSIAGLSPSSLAYVIYTSGSTGASKGVMVEHRSAVNFWRVMQDTTHRFCPAQGRVALNASYSFDMSLKGLLLQLSGRCVFVIPQLVRASGAELLKFLKRHQIDAFDCTPTQLDLLLSAGLIDESGGYQPKCVLIGGEAINPALWQKLKGAKAINFYNMYGPTEATVDATIGWLKELGERPSIGKPVAGDRIYLLDTHRQPVPLGVPGEIHIGGIGVARGYLHRPGLTDERFLPDPFSAEPNARMYKTGDLARWLPDGTLEYLGRNDFQVKIRGFRIELGEIEAGLLACDGVREAVVVAREDTPGDKRLVAYVVVHAVAPGGHAPDASTLRDRLCRTLAEYMIPNAFVFLPSLPVSPNGKLDRRMLPAPDRSSVAARRYEAPQGASEKAVAEVWMELLDLNRVGRHDHFFELGGHSLLIVSMIERLRLKGLPLDARTAFAHPVLRDLAAVLASRATGSDSGAPEVPPNLIPENCAAITPAMLPLVHLSQAEIDSIVAGAGGNPAEIQDIYPLSPLQEGILFHHVLNAGEDVYLQPVTMRFDSRKRLDHFLQALQTVIDRHDILRTGFHWEALSKPVQVVMRTATMPVREYRLDASDPVKQLQEIARREGLELRAAPLMEAHIAAEPGTMEWLLVLCHHHITVDHVAIGILVEEILAQLQGEADSLPVPVPYRNFIARLSAISREEHESYFRKRLGDIEEPTAPFGVLDVHRHGETLEECRTVLDTALSHKLRAKAKEHGVSAAVLFHVGFGIMLSRCVGRGNVVFGTVLLGRLQGTEGADKALGLFMNTLPLRLSLSSGSVGQAVREASRSLHELLAHEQAPLTLAQRCSGVTPPLPLFSALLNYRHSSGDAREMRQSWDGLQLLHVEERTNYPLTMSVDDLGHGFSLSLQCAPGIPAQRINAYMEGAMAAIADGLDDLGSADVSTLRVLPAAERRQVLQGFNATSLSYPSDALIHQLFEASARRAPDAVAIVFGDRSLSYGELNRRANRLARRLCAMGVAPGDRVAVCVERSIDMIAGLLAILKAGAAYVPLDPAYPAERLAFMLQDCTPAALITQSTLADRLPPHAVPPLCLDDLSLFAGLDAQDDANPVVAALSPSSLAYLIYTSGSTGHPKGVMIEHGNALNFIHWALASFKADVLARSVFSTSINFDLAVFELFAPLAAGTTIVLVDNILSSPAALVGSTLINTVPSALSALIDAGAVPSSLRMVNVAGEPLKRGLAERLFAHSGVERLANLYGPTETTTYSTWVAMDRATGFDPTVGRPVANTQIYILDGLGHPAPIGVAGEIYIGGAGVARGYLNRPELTAERFVADPFSSSPRARMYKTGDLGRWHTDGRIEYLGRNDFQVKIRGFRIELGEIESKLLACSGVKEAVVLAREDLPGDKRLVAYLVPQAHASLSPAGLRTELASSLAEYMVPSAFVILNALPLTPNGKLDRKALPAPDSSAVTTSAYEPPQGETEAALARIWQDLLGIERIGRHDHFFELGGHSLLVVQLVERMRRMQPPLTIPLLTLMHNPTIAAIAIIAAHPPALDQAVGPRQVIAVIGEAPPLPNNYWFFTRLSFNHWNSSALLEVAAPLGPDTIRSAVECLLAHHDGLRAVWRQQNGQWTMLIQEPSQMAPWWEAEDLSHVADAKVGEEIESRCARLQTTLDIGNILFRAVYFDLGEGRPARLMFVIHHLIIDGYSKAVFMQDLERACADLQQGRTPLLPPKTTSIKELAESIRRHAEGLDTQSELHYWQSRAWPRYRPLPVEAEPSTLAPDTGVAQHGVVFAELSADHTRRLESLPARLPGIHVEHILIAAIVMAWGKWSGTMALSLLTTHHGRSWGHGDIDLTRTVGWTGNFVNCMHDITDCASIRETLYAIKRQRDELLGKETHYSLLKYMHPDASVRAAMAVLPEHQLEFNFIPRHSSGGERPDKAHDAPVQTAFIPAKENAGSDDGDMHSGFTPFSKFHFDGERLKLYWVYCQTRHTAQTFGRFAGHTMRALEEIIEELELENEIGSV
jgi:amino acid adenylation domain-containing protein